MKPKEPPEESLIEHFHAATGIQFYEGGGMFEGTVVVEDAQETQHAIPVKTFRRWCEELIALADRVQRREETP